jgi:hypothetical protein
VSGRPRCERLRSARLRQSLCRDRIQHGSSTRGCIFSGIAFRPACSRAPFRQCRRGRTRARAASRRAGRRQCWRPERACDPGWLMVRRAAWFRRFQGEAAQRPHGAQSAHRRAGCLTCSYGFRLRFSSRTVGSPGAVPEKPTLFFKTGRKLRGRLNRNPSRPASAYPL